MKTLPLEIIERIILELSLIARESADSDERVYAAEAVRRILDETSLHLSKRR